MDDLDRRIAPASELARFFPVRVAYTEEQGGKIRRFGLFENGQWFALPPGVPVSHRAPGIEATRKLSTLPVLSPDAINAFGSSLWSQLLPFPLCHLDQAQIRACDTDTEDWVFALNRAVKAFESLEHVLARHQTSLLAVSSDLFRVIGSAKGVRLFPLISSDDIEASTLSLPTYELDLVVLSRGQTGYSLSASAQLLESLSDAVDLLALQAIPDVSRFSDLALMDLS